MAIQYVEQHAVLEGVVTVEDAEGLAQWLLVQQAPTLDLAACSHLHAAVLQVLLAMRPAISAPPADRWLAQALAAGSAEPAAA